MSSVPQRRNISEPTHPYFNEETQRYEQRSFEDLPKEIQIIILEGKNVEWLKDLILSLADTLHNVCSEFDIQRK